MNSHFCVKATNFITEIPIIVDANGNIEIKIRYLILPSQLFFSETNVSDLIHTVCVRAVHGMYTTTIHI